MAREVGKCSSEDWACGEPMSSFPIFSGGAWLLRVATFWSHLRKLHKISHMDWPYCYDSLLCSWCLLYHFLGIHPPNFSGLILLEYISLISSYYKLLNYIILKKIPSSNWSKQFWEQDNLNIYLCVCVCKMHKALLNNLWRARYHKKDRSQ